MLITGTFLDDGLGDIPSNNWGRKEWKREFRIMKAIGIDTVIPIRCGFKNWANYPSEVLKKEVNAYFCKEDLIKMFLELSEQFNMDFYIPTYCGWLPKEKELSINLAVIEELWNKYGKSKAIKGWYNTFELNSMYKDWVNIVKKIGLQCKKVSGNLPIILSPYIPYTLYSPTKEKSLKNTTMQKSDLQQHYIDWDEMLAELEGSIDIIAFQDGHVAYHELPEFLELNSRVLKRHGVKVWTNIETFSRDLPFLRFPPIDWRILQYKLEVSGKNKNIEKAITFEFSHFLSPYSFWPSARNLFYRYCEYHKLPADKIIKECS